MPPHCTPSGKLNFRLHHRCRWAYPKDHSCRLQLRLGSRTDCWNCSRCGTGQSRRPECFCRNSSTASRATTWRSGCQSPPGYCSHRRDTAGYTAWFRWLGTDLPQPQVPRLHSIRYSRRRSWFSASGCRWRRTDNCRFPVRAAGGLSLRL